MSDASRQYEDFGDHIAAADAAAQAVIAYQQAGLRGAAMTASATVQRLAAECQGANTPALRVASKEQPFTTRQRESRRVGVVNAVLRAIFSVITLNN